MAGSGPTPNPASRRQSGNQAHTWTDLPANGYDGPIPAWPLGDPALGELSMWERYWRKPQAAAWARMSLVDEAALYVRAFLLGADGNVKAMTEARQMADRLGLNPTAMLKNRWRIATDEVAAARATKPQAANPRKRLKVADGAVAGG